MGGLIHTIRFVFGIFGNAASPFLFLVPTYGLPFITANNILVATINGTGGAIELIYVLIFFLYAPYKEKRKIFAIFVLVLFAFAAAAVFSVLVFHGRNRKLFCGVVATIFSIVMYASPLSIIRLVIRTNSVEYMPFFLSFAVVVSCTSWFIYAMLGMDPFIAISTGIGLVLGIVQLILYFIYRDKKTSTVVDESQNVQMFS